MEIEAKFGIPDERTFRRLLETTTLAGFSLSEATLIKLHDRYLDTAGRAILAGGYACRLRRQDGRTLVSLKGLGGAAGAVHRRAEYQVELTDPLPPQEWPPGQARDLALSLGGGEPLLPLFELEQTRHCRLLYDGDRAVAELALDRVEVYGADLRRPTISFLELEAELLADGSEEDLHRLVADLQTVWGLTPEPRSKFERALALFPAGSGGRLTPAERAVVERLAQGREALARRARLLLAWDDGLSRAEMLERARLSPRRARYWLSAFHRQRLGIFPHQELNPAPTTGPAIRQEQEEEPDRPPLAAEKEMPAAPPPQPAPPVELLKRPGIDPDDPMSEAGRKILRFHWRRLLFHEPGTRLGQDIEALHDMRVATRRMRAALRVFADYYEAQAIAPLLKGLRRTGRALGAVRDLDVFRARVQAHLSTLPEAQRGDMDSFLAVLEEQRDTARQAMLAYLDSSRYARFKDRFTEFVETEGLGSRPITLDEGDPHPYRVRHAAPVAVYERLAAVRAYDEWVTIPNPPLTRLHALRIACKRLRYTLEFFGEVLGPETPTLIKEVVALQDHLGELQDAVVASGILRDFLVWGTWGGDVAARPSPDRAAPVVAPGVAAYLAVRQAELQHLLVTFPQAWQRFNSTQFSRLVAQAVAIL